MAEPFPLRYIVNHVFLPLNLPHKDDQPESYYANDHDLALLTLQCASKFCEEVVHSDEELSVRWNPILAMLENFAHVNDAEPFTADDLRDQLTSLSDGDILVLLIRKQNTGLIIRVLSDKIGCEMFEVSIPNKEVLACTGKLRRSFPDVTISFGRSHLENEAFCREFASVLYQMNVDELDESSAHTKKAGSVLKEIRDPPSPHLITDWLAGVLGALDGGIEAPATSVTKRIADDVLWKSALKPWRRSQVWLVLRVAMQTTLTRAEYKSFMLYMMTSILEMASQSLLGSDLLSCMRTKIARRAVKLDASDCVPAFVQEKVFSSNHTADDVMHRRWKSIQESFDDLEPLVPWDPKSLNIAADAHVKLPRSTPYISRILRRSQADSQPSIHTPNHSHRLRHRPDLHSMFCQRLKEGGENLYLNLADFEDAIRDDLGQWTQAHKHDATVPHLLRQTMSDYYTIAHSAYKDNPENMSLMVLVILELWVALDKVVVTQCPLLLSYPPEIPENILQPLLLRKGQDLARVAPLVQYLRDRRGRSNRPSVFGGICEDSFAVKFFESSRQLQRLKVNIENQADKMKQQKMSELRQKNEQHRRLTEQAERQCHDDHPWVVRRIRKSKRRGYYDESNCKKCHLIRQVNDLKIEVYEWPLPSSEAAAKTVVFELNCPVEFAEWREATFLILHDIFTLTSTKSITPHVHAILHDYMATKSIQGDKLTNRITLSSTTKSMHQSHYSNPRLPASQSDVCVNHGLTWGLHDKDNHVQIPFPGFHNAEVSSVCTLSFPAGELYDGLQFAVRGTSHTSNEVTAKQAHCPKDLNLHEFFSFASIRSGSHMQWMNIAGELAGRSLTFNRQPVDILLAQAIQQVGEVSELGDMIWHASLHSPEFLDRILLEMERLHNNIRDNWQELVTVKTLILIATRLLASAQSISYIRRIIRFLLAARDTTYQWLCDRLACLDNSQETHANYMKARLREIAAACRQTYDVDDVHSQALLQSPRDIALFLHCVIVIRDHRTTAGPSSSSPEGLLLARDHRLAHNLEPKVRQLCLEDGQGLHQAIAAVWPAYRPSSKPFHAMETPNERWIYSSTLSFGGQQSQHIQLDILGGKLLVDGKPLGPLPDVITTHKTYQRLFGRTVLHVVPSDIAGMDYKSRTPVCGSHVFFSHRNNDLVVQALPVQSTSVAANLLEHIPFHKFDDDLPAHLVEEFVQWIHLHTGCIELRPLTEPWISSPKHWYIEFRQDSRSLMYRGSNNSHLVDRNSKTFRMLYGRLQALEHPKFVVMMYRPKSLHPLSIQLPRFRLNFLLDMEHKRIQCQSLPNTFVDPNQSIGALHGLKNKLVLRNNIRADFPRIRRVLIPRGRVGFRQCSGHVAVEIDTDIQMQREVSYYGYTIDLELRSLIGDGSLESRLFKTYLHALTSYCLSDSLTGRTGLEEALYELNSAGCMSFKRLKGLEVEILREIRALTPKRKYYPDHLKVMQTVQWNDLPAYSQAHGFERRVIEIFAYDHHLSLFDDPTYPTAPFSTVEDRRYRSSDVLYSRATAREFSAFPFEVLTSSRDKLEAMDMTYVSRGLQMSHDRKHYAAARMVSLMTPELFSLTTSSLPLFDMFKSWGRLSLSPSDETAVSYTRDWFEKSDLPDAWLALYDVCRSMTNSIDVKKYKLLFSLSAWLYTSKDNVCMSVIPQLVAFACHSRIFQAVEPPQWKSYRLSYGTAPTALQVSQIIKRHQCSINTTPSSQLVQEWGENEEDRKDRCQNDYDNQIARGMSELQAAIMSQWPGSRSPSCLTGYDGYFEMSGLTLEVRELFENCGHNSDLQNFANRVQVILRTFGVPSNNNHVPTLPFNPINSLQTNRISPVSDTASGLQVDLKTLFLRPAPLASMALASRLDSAICTSQAVMSISGKYVPESAKQLRHVLVQFGKKPHYLHRRYARDMLGSLEDEVAVHKTVSTPSSGMDFEKAYRQCRERFEHVHATVLNALQPSTLSDEFLFVSSRWPRVTLKTILFQMTAGPWSKLTLEWKHTLILLATELLQLQRSRRLLQLSLTRKEDDLRKETQSQSHMPLRMALEHPDWLLIQIEHNFLARPIQLRIATEMYSPGMEGNITLQLNMGEGKSSVIVPMVACSLADGQTLVRVVVLKSLGPQMFQLLVDRVAGLANRRVAYFPFSRQIHLQSAADMASIKSLYENCKKDAGVLLVQPEHILSAKLLSIEKILVSVTDQKSRELASGALQLQRWLEENARDILDESDEELHVRYQLIYTMGLQAPIEGIPHRWTTAQQLLSLFLKNIRLLKARLSDECVVAVGEALPWTFPHIQFPQSGHLNIDAGAQLNVALVDDVLASELPDLNVTHFTEDCRGALRSFLTDHTPSAEAVDLLKDQDIVMWKTMLLLRGLLVNGILFYTLRYRRWRVDYGLDPSRSILAVPYRAKDVPSPRAEFGHPDVAILLTCLAYYYHGLSSDQVAHCFSRLFKLSNPAEQYKEWTRIIPPDDLPDSICEFIGINTEDIEQHERTLVPLFKHNRCMIDFYLSDFVFPKAAKEFPNKLPTSGWDLAESRNHHTTGFSGTNDNRYLLPLSIQQVDPVGQGGTNALVLMHLLHPTNSHYFCASNANREPLLGKEFVELINKQQPQIRVLLDVGAQMLDLQNKELVQYWLDVNPNADAGIYFDDDDQLMVISRDGTIEPFRSSPYREQTGKCIVYLDDAHTRGTDLKLPHDWRAAVTLGRKVTKDRLVQGCMRMRQLGNGQSVMFFAPPEVDVGIRKEAGKTSQDMIIVEDIIQWCMVETCNDIEHHAPAWAEQGADYMTRRRALDILPQEVSETDDSDTLRNAWLQREARPLEVMYMPLSEPTVSAGMDVPELRERLVALGLGDMTAGANIDEEQEREVSHEMEVERFPERPRPIQAASHSLHQHVRRFVRTGELISDSPAFVWLPHILQSIPLWNKYAQMQIFSDRLLATRDFAVTVQQNSEFDTGVVEFLKPPRWLLSWTKDHKGRSPAPLLLILSQYEANELLPSIRASKFVQLHLYAPRVTPSMPIFDNLSFLGVSPQQIDPMLILQLNLFAGQLYPTNYADYVRICGFLGVDAEGKLPSQSDGFVLPRNRHGHLRGSPFTRSPMPFLKYLFGLRRKGQTYDKSPMGKLLSGRILKEDAFVDES